MGIGPLLKTWRTKRRLSQLDLALEAGVSTRHLSFVETGRSRPSEQMVLHLAEQLDVPLRERNRLLLAAGYAPMLLAAAARRRSSAPVKDALDQLLTSHEPFPAIVVDRAWNVVAANAAIADAHRGRRAAPARAAGQRAAAHPAPRGHGAPHRQPRPVARAPARATSRRRRDATGDDELAALLEELRALPGPEGEPRRSTRSSSRSAHRRPLVPEHPHDVRHRARRDRRPSWRSRRSSPPTRDGPLYGASR